MSKTKKIKTEKKNVSREEELRWKVRGGAASRMLQVERKR
jgi:hypothetical protein